jgi:hypothetical protein
MQYDEIKNETLCQAVERYGERAKIAIYSPPSYIGDLPYEAMAVDALPLILARLRDRDAVRDKALDLLKRIASTYRDGWSPDLRLYPLIDETYRLLRQVQRP